MPRLNDEQLELLSDEIRPLFQEMEKEVIADIARRVQKTLTYTRTAELMAMEMQKLGYSPAKIRSEVMRYLNADKDFQKVVAENTMEYKREVKELIENIVRKAAMKGDTIVANAGEMSWIDDMRVWEAAGKKLGDNSYLHLLIDAVAEQTRGELKNLTGTTGFKTKSGYESVRNAYRKELDKAAIKVCTGTFSSGRVLDDLIHSLAQSGLRSVDFDNNYSMALDTAAKTALRTGCAQIAAKVMDRNVLDTGENLIYVSRHVGARNTGVGHANHEQWQGKVYFARPGTDYGEEERRIGQKIKSLYEATGYSVTGEELNDPLGLHGYNCRHRHDVWFEGISEFQPEQPDPEPVVINGKKYDYYAMTQKMRSMERNIRALKKERNVRKSLGMDDTEVRKKITQKTREYKEFCKKCRVPERTTNLRVYDGTENTQKSKAYKEYGELVKQQERDKIELDNYKKALSERTVLKLSDVKSAPFEGKAHSIVDLVDETGWVKQRRVFGSDGRPEVDYDTNDHNKPKYHPTGAHKHTYNYENKKPHSVAKKLTELDLRKNSDIIRKGDNYHEPKA